MAKDLTKKQWLARAEAYSKAAEHLGQHWTDDPEERAQGDKVARRLRDISINCFKKADAGPAALPKPITLADALNRSLSYQRS